jgi:NADH:ubiquinone oxidoreductase subunit D
MTASSKPGGARADSLSEALGFQEAIVEIAMTHPGVRRVLSGVGGTIGFIASLDDDRMTSVEVEIGFGHRGFEKQAEARAWSDALPYVSRLGYAGSIAYELAYCGAVENLAGVALPERAIWLRTFAAELSRVCDHFARLAGVAAAVELPVAEQAAQVAALDVARLMAAALSRGPLAGWARLGGVASSLADGFDAAWPGARESIEESLRRFETVGMRNPGLDRRLRDVGILSADQCALFSVTGPASRAAGSPMDLRKETEYLAYGSVDFEIPIAEHGDAYDRMLVVIEEIRQSLRIVDQCRKQLRDLGEGSIQSTALADDTQIEAGSSSFFVEGSTGELGFFVVSDGSSRPRRVRCRAPSFYHAQALTTLLEGAALDDLLPSVASMHIVSPECDR